MRLKTAPESVIEIHFESSRRDARMRSVIDRAADAKIRLIECAGLQLSKPCGSHGHQGVVARVTAIAQVTSLRRSLTTSAMRN